MLYVLCEKANKLMGDFDETFCEVGTMKFNYILIWGSSSLEMFLQSAFGNYALFINILWSLKNTDEGITIGKAL